MSPLFKKLNLKTQTEILVLNAPESFESELTRLEKVTVQRNIDAVEQIEFSLAFVSKQEEVNLFANAIASLVKGDALVWFAYPKKSSKRYQCEFNRDTGWDVLGELGFEAVRQVAIDEDWSALRFRRVEFIKKMVRDKSRAMTKKGKQRLADQEAKTND
jgi:hypothetical protein